jgi:hypothetical protein
LTAVVIASGAAAEQENLKKNVQDFVSIHVVSFNTN